MRVPGLLAELTDRPVHLSSFIPPGKYSLDQRRQFDFSFLRQLRAARILRTTAITDYQWRRADRQPSPGCVEIRVDLGEWQVVIGNLPVALLVPQEDFALAGFGVGILASSDFAERRRFLIDAGPPPSFAYLCRRQDERTVVVNSHEYGLEQIFIRTHIQDREPWWEVTLTSYERIVDVVKYRIVIPPALVGELHAAAVDYAAPHYRSYRDDNLR